MSNILIIKLGSLGDIVQISGVLRDIRENHRDKKIFILTTSPYVELLNRCPFVDGVLIDRRLPRWNIPYILKLRKMIKKFNFNYIFDLQNSSRTSFYRRYLFSNLKWSSSATTLRKEKKFLNQESVLERFKLQLDKSNVKTKYSLKPDFSWACVNIDQIVNKYFGKDFILIFPFSSPKLSHKQWPYYNALIKTIKSKHQNLEIVIAPGPNEIENAKKFDATCVTNNFKPLNIMELAGLIKKSKFIIANDTGPAHIAAHLGKNGIVIFGHHTSPHKVSIETNNFKALTVKNLNDLTVETVYQEIKKKLDLIN